jgi:hypothetical protein
MFNSYQHKELSCSKLHRLFEATRLRLGLMDATSWFQKNPVYEQFKVNFITTNRDHLTFTYLRERDQTASVSHTLCAIVP